MKTTRIPRLAPLTVLLVALGVLHPVAVEGQSTSAMAVEAQDGPTITEIGGSTDAREGEGLAFGVGVYNPTGETLEFRWTLGDGTDAVSGPGLRAVTHRYQKDGEFVVGVSVTGSSGFSAERQLDITVRNGPPVIQGMSANDPIQPGHEAHFRSAAIDPGGDELTYSWDFGDGSPPVEGVDLTEPQHTYGEPGEYTVTLTVTDPEEGETSRELLVEVNPGFLGEIAGEVPRFPFQGESGPSSLSSGLGAVNIFSGAAPMSGGVADLSMLGICLVNAGFWDDRSKAHINFILTLPADSAFVPKMYLVGWEGSDDGIPAGQLLINAMVLWIDPIYEKTREGAENMQIGSGGGLFDLLAQGLAGNLEAEELGPGRNWQLTANAGFVEITRVTPEQIEGKMQAYLQGAWVEAEASGQVVFSRIKGTFAYRLDDVARANLLRCADVPFTIDSHKPVVEELNVDFADPAISLKFTHPFMVNSVNESTIQVGYLSGASAFVPIEGSLSVDPDGQTVRFTPDERLLDAVYYHVRVKGGSSGVKSIAGDALEEDYEWRFVTVVDLLEREEEG